MPEIVRDSRAHFRLSWRVLAISSTVLAVVALTVVVILTATTDADALSSVALILAVLAFIIQIIVFIADFAFNARRDKEAQTLNASTLALLAKIEEKANSTNQVVGGQMTKLIDNLILGDKYAAKSGYADAPDVEARREVLSDLRETVARAESSSPRQMSAPGVPTKRRAEEVESWPPPGVVSRLSGEGMDDLREDALVALVELGRDVRESFENGYPEGVPDFLLSSEEIAEYLLSRRYIRTPKVDEKTIRELTLTGKGFAAARVLLAPNPIPEFVARELPWLEAVRTRLRDRGLID